MYKRDYSGQKFNEWTVISKSDKKGHESTYICKCSCGSIFKKAISYIKRFSRCHRCSSILSRHNSETITGHGWSALKINAKARGHIVEISPEYANELLKKQNYKCALSGLPITLISNGGIKTCNQTASLDRIDSSKGYIEGNVQWVHKHINKIKQNFKEDYFINMCEKVVNHQRNK